MRAMDTLGCTISPLPIDFDLETKPVLLQLASAHRRLAELKGLAHSIPNESILISTLALQEAKDSSRIENIVTTSDDLYQAALHSNLDEMGAAAKEVLNYRQALEVGFEHVKSSGILTLNDIKKIQAVLVNSRAGFRTLPGTQLRNSKGEIVYTPPQDPAEVLRLMGNLEGYINEPWLQTIDPLIKMAIIHHQFESIHPFYDGNGRTGRIVAILYLVLAGLLDLPILYLSRYIIRTKSEYYRLLQGVRNDERGSAAAWEAWILYILRGVEETAIQTTNLVKGISELMADFKRVLRPALGKSYQHELLNSLFIHPYTKIAFMGQELNVLRKTAAKYLDIMVQNGVLTKRKIGHTNYYINVRLLDLLGTGGDTPNGLEDDTVKTVRT